ncbi:glutamate--cysteine ligase [Hyphomicrobiales bacterium]|nr:glutamate--cysteine ligase [Hyphomicrobiales bacterium]MDG1151832.1 glutamate--cysteine ligase [Hyphomicrobiales bacterium]MDG1523493.1 glutamate--cysteine ligase [Hyphomicrobiales bacterium]MDG2413502.1 glutamate--cysteine ligase [Hyphomicrobiales bacterium]
MKNNFIEIQSKEDLIKPFQNGEKKPSDFKIGTEHEKFVFHIDTLKPVPFLGESGIENLLLALKKYGWESILEDGNTIGLSRDKSLGGGTITLEPAGQLELSGAPLTNIHETFNELDEHRSQISKEGSNLGLGFLGAGLTPDWSFDEMPIMPKSRYQIMKNYMPKKGNLGLDMMFRSTTIQVNLDYSSESDMIKKFKVSLALQPIATALFANSPFLDGNLTGYNSFRSHIWTDTDPDRTGMLPFVFDGEMSYEKYVDYALKVPMYFIYRDGNYLDVSGSSFEDFLNGDLDELPNEKPNIIDWENHLTTIFPEVRLKSFLEMRGADGGSFESVCALSSFWVGLLYDSESLDSSFNLIKDFNIKQLQELRIEVAKNGLHSIIEGIEIQEIAKKVLKLSREGLRNRNILNENGDSEEIFLDPLQKILSSGKSSSDDLIKKFSNNWNKNLVNMYKEYTF